jgi:hypothetical protein
MGAECARVATVNRLRLTTCLFDLKRETENLIDERIVTKSQLEDPL